MQKKIPDYKLFEAFVMAPYTVEKMEKITKKKNRFGGWTYSTRVIYKGHENNRFSFQWVPGTFEREAVAYITRSEKDGIFWTTVFDWGANSKNTSFKGGELECVRWVKQTMKLKNIAA